MLDHAKCHGEEEPNVLPRLHDEEGLVLGEAVEGVEHFNHHKDGESEGHGFCTREDGAGHVGEIRLVDGALQVMSLQGE